MVKSIEYLLIPCREARYMKVSDQREVLPNDRKNILAHMQLMIHVIQQPHVWRIHLTYDLESLV